MRPASPALVLTEPQRLALSALARSTSSSHREVVRARALLLASEGVATTRIAAVVAVSPATVTAWRERFADVGLVGLGVVRAGRGRKPRISGEQVAEIIRLTLDERPDGETRWSCRTMAQRAGVSASTVQRVWSARGLRPHRVATLELSHDPVRASTV